MFSVGTAAFFLKDADEVLVTNALTDVAPLLANAFSVPESDIVFDEFLDTDQGTYVKFTKPIALSSKDGIEDFDRAMKHKDGLGEVDASDVGNNIYCL